MRGWRTLAGLATMDFGGTSCPSNSGESIFSSNKTNTRTTPSIRRQPTSTASRTLDRIDNAATWSLSSRGTDTNAALAETLNRIFAQRAWPGFTCGVFASVHTLRSTFALAFGQRDNDESRPTSRPDQHSGRGAARRTSSRFLQKPVPF